MSFLRPSSLLGSNSLLAITVTLLLAYTTISFSADGPQFGRQQFTQPFPLEFEPNNGQVAPEVEFFARAPGFSFFALRGKVVLSLQPAPANFEAARRVTSSQAQPALIERAKSGKQVLTLQFLNADARARISGIAKRVGVSHYLIGADPAAWHTNVPHFGKIQYSELYPGIDLVFYGNGRQLEFDLIAHPGADPRNVAFDITGADRITADDSGDLVVGVGNGDLRFHLPDVYQVVNGKKIKIPGGYRLAGKRVVFDVGAYDKRHTLIIDPVLAYATYLGGSGDEDFVTGGIAVDHAGQAFIGGATASLNFPTTAGAHDRSYNGGGSDAIVAKLNATGTGLVYTTFIGGTGHDVVSGLKVDSTGHPYVTGSTDSPNFPGVRISPTVTGNPETFVLKLNAAGSGFVYAVKFGGAGFGSSGRGIAIDPNGHAYVTGDATPGFPTTPGAFQRTTNRGAIFVSKLNVAGTGFLYSTLVDGPGDESPSAIAIDPSGNAYVAGSVEFGDFITTAGAFQPHNLHPDNGNVTGIAFALNSTGSQLIYSTHLGGSFTESIFGLAVDSSGHAFVTGYSESPDFPTTAGALRRTFQEEEAFVTKLKPDGTGLVYSTFVGGSSFEVGGGIAIDILGSAYITGFTVSPDFPTTTAAFQRVENGSFDQFVTKLNATGSRIIYSSYLGGSGDDISIPAIALDLSNNVYILGQTGSTDFPVTPDAFQQKFAGGNRDMFVAKIVPLCSLTSLATVCSPQDGATLKSPIQLMAGTNDFTPVKLIQVYIDGQKSYEARLAAVDVRLPLSVGPHRVTVQAFDTGGVIFKKTINITVVP